MMIKTHNDMSLDEIVKKNFPASMEWSGLYCAIILKKLAIQ